MKIKSDSIPPVEMNVCSFIMERIPRLDELMLKYTKNEAIVTSGSEKGAPHMKGSKHFSGEAIDVRNWGIVVLSNTGKRAFFGGLGQVFDDLKFDIVEHNSHIHIEFDPISYIDKYTVRGIEVKLKKRKEMVKVELPPLRFESKFRRVVNKSYDVVKVTSNIIGRHYAGVTIFKKKKDEGIIDMIRRILINILDKIKGRQ